MRQVLLITNMYPSVRDQTYGLFVQRCAVALEANGVGTEVVALTKYNSLLCKALGYLRFALQANAKILLTSSECVYIHHPLHTLLVCLPALALRRRKVALSFHGHDLLPVTRRGELLLRILAKRFSAAQVIVVPSRSFKSHFDARYGRQGAASAQVFYSGGAEEAYFQHDPPSSASRGRSALFLSRLVREKGWPVFLNVAQSLLQRHPDFRFTIAGVGPDKEAIREAIVNAGLAQCVQIAEAISADINRELFDSHRYFIFPSRFNESLALVNLEAMARGCIVMSSDFPAASEYITHGENGLRLELPTFVDACVGEVLRLEDDVASADRISQTAVLTARQFRETRVMRQLPIILGLSSAS